MESSAPGASTRMEGLFDNRWFGKDSTTATPCNTVVRRRPARHGAMGRGSTRLPLLGAPAASSRRGAPQHGAIAQRKEHPAVDRKDAGSNPAGLAHGNVSRVPPARARCRTHLAPEERQGVPICTLGDDASSIWWTGSTFSPAFQRNHAKCRRGRRRSRAGPSIPRPHLPSLVCDVEFPPYHRPVTRRTHIVIRTGTDG